MDSLRRALQREDGTLGHPYFRDLRAWSRREAEPTSREALVRACTRATVVYVGDFHADPECARFAAGLLEDIAARVSGLGLGVEFVFTRQQRVLDQRQRGELGDDAFHRRVHYRDQWGFPWAGYRALLDRARALDIPVFALDSAPRGGASRLSARDEHAATRIVRLLTEGRAARLLVFFGESHVTPGKLPKRVRERAGRPGSEISSVTVLQDPEGAYWNFLAKGTPPPPFVDLGGNCLAAFHTPPLQRYERYRQVLERWRGEALGDFDSDFTPGVHHLIDVLARWLGIRPDRRRVRFEGGWSELLRDCYPEVYSGSDAALLLATILREHGRTEEEIREAERNYGEREALYEPRSNTFFLARFLPGPASGEAARFLRAALTGRLFHWPGDPEAEPWDRAYGYAYVEALSFLGARLIDPAFAAGSLPPTRGEDEVPLPAKRLEWLERHRTFEASGRYELPEELLAPLRSSRTVRRVLARDLGHRLGAELYARVRSGRMDTRTLRALFAKRLDRARARARVLELLRAS